MNLVGIAREVRVGAERLGWKVDEIRLASTGSIYLELIRDGREWVVIRVADHAQVYHRWLKTYSISPRGYSVDRLIEELGKPFGEVGDVLL